MMNNFILPSLLCANCKAEVYVIKKIDDVFELFCPNCSHSQKFTANSVSGQYVFKEVEELGRTAVFENKKKEDNPFTDEKLKKLWETGYLSEISNFNEFKNNLKSIEKKKNHDKSFRTLKNDYNELLEFLEDMTTDKKFQTMFGNIKKKHIQKLIEEFSLTK